MRFAEMIHNRLIGNQRTQKHFKYYIFLKKSYLQGVSFVVKLKIGHN